MAVFTVFEEAAQAFINIWLVLFLATMLQCIIKFTVFGYLTYVQFLLSLTPPLDKGGFQYFFYLLVAFSSKIYMEQCLSLPGRKNS